MRILVTGRRGQLVQSLIERADGVPGLTLMAAGRPQLEFENPATICAIIEEAAPDIVINAAAYTAVDLAEDEPERAFEINATAAGEVAMAARRAGAAVIQVSTDYVFDGSTGPYAEDARTDPIGVYGRSKLEGEQRVRDANPDHAIVRTAWLYSPFARNFVRTMVLAADQHADLTVVNDQRGNPSSALDVADGLLRMAGQWHRVGASGGAVYHLVGTGNATWFDLAVATIATCERDGRTSPRVRPIGTDARPTRAVRPRNSTLSCSRFAADFGYTMPDWRRSLPPIVERIRGRA